MSYPTAPRFFVGVDPGLTGGVAVLDHGGGVVAKFAMPRREDGSVDSDAILAALPLAVQVDGSSFLAVEKVWSFPNQGVSSTFTFGKVTGVVTGVLETVLGVRAYEVAPQTWQRKLWGNVADPKRAAAEFAERNWPEESFLVTARSRKPHQGMVDAAGIAEWARTHWTEVTR